MTPTQMGNHVLMELMLESLPPACRNAVLLQSPKDAMELARVAEKFFADRNSNIDDPKWMRGSRAYQQGESSWSKGKNPANSPQAEGMQTLSQENNLPPSRGM